MTLRAGLARVIGPALVLLAGCAIEPEEAEFLVDPSGLEAPLASWCADGAVEGSLLLTISDFTGATYVAEPSGDRIWVRSAFGIVPDHCYWVSTEPDHPEWPEDTRPDCFIDGLTQDGSCRGDEASPDGGGWKFVHGGFVTVPNLRSRLAVDGRLAVAWAGQDPPTLRVVDLVPDDDGCPEDQRPWSMHNVLYTLDVPAGYTGFLDGDLAVVAETGRLIGVSPQDEELAVWSLPLPCEDGATLPDPERIPLPATPDGPLALEPGGRIAFVLSSEGPSVIGIEDIGRDDPVVHRRVLSGMADPTDVAYDPFTRTVWVASPTAGGGKVKSFGLDGGPATVFHAPGVSRLAVGTTSSAGQSVPRVYGVAEGGDRAYRFDPVTGEARAQTLDGTIRGLAIGGALQEIAVALERSDGSVVLRSFLAADQLEVQPPGAVRIVAAGFLEYPRDAQLDDPEALTKEIDTEPEACADLEQATAGWPELDRRMYQVCCLQSARADKVTGNLAYLEGALLDRLPGEDEVELLLGINPTVLLQSAHCIHAGLDLGRPELIAFGAELPRELATWRDDLEARGDVGTTLLVHTPAGTDEQVPYTCPELWEPDLPDPDCDVAVQDQQAFVDFLGDLLDTAALRHVAEPHQGTGGCGEDELPLPEQCVDPAEWGWAPDGLAGGFDRAVGLHAEVEAISWPSAYAAAWPGSGTPFTYFGGGGSYPGTSHAVAKELAPWDAAERIAAFDVDDDPDEWDPPTSPTGGPIVYLPGVTIAQTRIYEVARSGLFVSDMFWHGLVEGEHWQSEAFPGTESPETMSPADFALLHHYLVYRVVAAQDPARERVFYFHLPDIGTLGLPGYADGRVTCTDPGSCETRDALQDWVFEALPALGPAIAWGLPEEL